MDTKLIVNKQDLNRLPMSWYGDEQEQIAKKLKEAIGSQWDNNRLMFEYDGLFSFSVHRQRFTAISPMAEQLKKLGKITFTESEDSHRVPFTNVFGWYLWAGGSSLGNEYFIQELDEPMPKKVVVRICTVCRDYNENKIECSSCGKLINIADIAGQYFAGVYCEDCWESKYKAIEAAETYN